MTDIKLFSIERTLVCPSTPITKNSHSLELISDWLDNNAYTHSIEQNATDYYIYFKKPPIGHRPSGITGTIKVAEDETEIRIHITIEANEALPTIAILSISIFLLVTLSNDWSSSLFFLGAIIVISLLTRCSIVHEGNILLQSISLYFKPIY